MTPDPRFLRLPKPFWANIRTISQEVGYTRNASRKKGEGQIHVPTLAEASAALERLQLTAAHLAAPSGEPTTMGRQVLDYFQYRADTLNGEIEPLLMDAAAARAAYETLWAEASATGRSFRPPPVNKQKDEKKAVAYFTAMINLLVERTLWEEDASDIPCDYDPHVLTTATRDAAPLRTLARRVDGAFPGTVNPVAVWGIKEYYYTTTFGSRVADGVYETLLDGLEIEELRQEERIDIQHFLMVDSHYTWWICGKSYLCRIMDMLHMGYVDGVLFGREVIAELPRIVRSWIALERARVSPEAQPATNQ